MTKYFYDSAIDAMYMMHHFGVRLLDEVTDPEENIELTLQLLVEGGDIFQPISCYYIHPDSLDVLAPMNLDLVEISSVKDGSRFYEVYQEKGLGGKLAGHDYKVILRDNKPFIWPKSEEI